MEDVQCLLETEAAASALFTVADTSGVSRTLDIGNWREYPWASITRSGLHGNVNTNSGRKTIDYQDFLQKVADWVPPPKPITIANYTVEFPDNYDGIQVGCTKVPTATVDEIYKRLHETK